MIHIFYPPIYYPLWMLIDKIIILSHYDELKTCIKRRLLLVRYAFLLLPRGKRS